MSRASGAAPAGKSDELSAGLCWDLGTADVFCALGLSGIFCTGMGLQHLGLFC